MPLLLQITIALALSRTMQRQKQVSAGDANVGGRIGCGGGGAGGGGGVTVCRPSGLRWTPTPEQLRILKELYYTWGIRSPTADEIQRITGMLRPHGKIEGKNVFYWFQNHKARERQKKRLTNLDVNAPAAGADVILSLSSPSGTTSPSPTLGMYPENGGASSAMQLDTTNSAMYTDQGCFLQDYMGGGTGAVATSSPWALFSSSDQRTMTMTRAPETLPLFPTSYNDNRLQPSGHGGRGGFFWGAAPAPAAAATAATSTTTVTIQQQHYSRNSNHQLPRQQGTAAAAGASLELSLNSSWCSPYHAGAGTM